MSKKTCLLLKTIFFACLVLSLTVFIFPPNPTNALLTDCQSGSNASSIRPGSGDLLTSLNDNSTGAIRRPDAAVCGSRASISLTSSYESLKSLYFEQQSTLGKKTITDSKGIDFNIPLHYVAGNLTVAQKINVPAKKSTVVFVDGDLNLSPTAPGHYNIIEDQNSSGIVFVVGGGINVHKDVRQINAFIITFGQFCSAGSYPCPNSVTVTDPLLINGSVVALSSDPAKKPLFVRNLNSGNALPAERVVYQPKYLVILKDVFARTRQTWSELTDYAP